LDEHSSVCFLLLLFEAVYFKDSAVNRFGGLRMFEKQTLSNIFKATADGRPCGSLLLGQL